MLDGLAKFLQLFQIAIFFLFAVGLSHQASADVDECSMLNQAIAKHAAEKDLDADPLEKIETFGIEIRPSANPGTDGDYPWVEYVHSPMLLDPDLSLNVDINDIYPSTILEINDRPANQFTKKELLDAEAEKQIKLKIMEKQMLY